MISVQHDYSLAHGPLLTVLNFDPCGLDAKKFGLY